MYAPQSLYDLLFMMLYGGITMAAFVAGIYLWLRRSNVIAPEVTPPRALRLLTAAFFLMAAASHVWWYVLGVYWLVDDRLVRNTLCIMFDHITLVPLVMALLLRLLQDRRRRIWPWVATQVLIIGGAVVGIANHSEYGMDLMHRCQVVIIALFVTYYIYALVRYSRWLKENYADLEHKEVWQSLLFIVALFLIYEVYSTNPGDMPKEYLSQINTLIIIIFLLWRVETLQTLEVKKDTSYVPTTTNIGTLLQMHCEVPQLYLQHDLTLAQLSKAVGTNRTYLSAYFTQQGTTYNAYINRLRIEHFENLYNKAVAQSSSVTAQQLAHDCGFKSYSTFAAAFKNFKGLTVTAWMKSR